MDQESLAAKPVEVRSSEGLGLAVWQSKCNTFFNEVGELATLLASSTGKKGMQTWGIANSPKAKDTSWPT